jgi:pyrroloquinoline-quinone synthase
MDIATTPTPDIGLPPWTPAEFKAQLHEKGGAHAIRHPFSLRMNAGRCTPDELRCWVANRFYYQVCIPRKDAAILANMPDREHRRLWVERILGHDGYGDAPGSIEAWTRMGEAVGLEREDLWSLRRVAPAVRFACDSYVHFAARAPWQEAVCSSLIEMLAPPIHPGWSAHYPWIDAEGLAYFRSRMPPAGRDTEHGMLVTLAHFTTRPAQQRALDILQFKLNILWSVLDAIERACA